MSLDNLTLVSDASTGTTKLDLSNVPELRHSPKFSWLRKTNNWVVEPVLVIHGGAGTFSREQSTPEKRELYRNALREALLRGYEVLQSGGEAMDAATAAVVSMEGK